MVLFDTLKPIISNVCKIANFESKDIDARYKFVLDLYQLEQNISKADPTFHILAVNDNEEDLNMLYSKALDNGDITNIMEYIHKPKDVESFINDKVNYVEFMIYCTDIKDEDLKNKVLERVTAGVEGGETHTTPVICPNRYDGINDFVTDIISFFPIYKVLVMRKFNFKKDKFTYSIVFRSNYEMIEYVNNHFKKIEKKETPEESTENN